MTIRNLPLRLIFAIAATGVLLIVTTTGLLVANQTVPLNGTITMVNVGLYWDVDCTQNVTTLDFGTLNPGDSFMRTVYVKNTGTVQETLSMTADNWVPINADSIVSLSWNRQNFVLSPEQVVQAMLTLTIASDTDNLTSFGCDVTFTGNE